MATERHEHPDLFVFDPQRNAVLLVAGDKTGEWRSWYATDIPVAEKRYTTWLEREGQ